MKSRLHHGSNGPRTNRVCAQAIGQGMPIRFSREDARQLVEVDHDGEYCKKSVWRAHQKYVAEHDPESREWPFSERFYRINAKGVLEGAPDEA